MKITVEASRLRDALKSCAATPRAIIPITKGVLLDPVGSSVVMVRSLDTNNGIYLEDELACTVEDEGPGIVVEAQPLAAALNGINGRVVLTVDKSGVSVTRPEVGTHRFNYSLPYWPAKDFPWKDTPKHVNDLEISPIELRDAINVVSYCVDPKLFGHPSMVGVHVGKSIVGAVDGMRAAVSTIDNPGGEVFFIRHGGIAPLLAELKKDCFITLGRFGKDDSPDCMMVQNEGRTFTLKLESETMPPIQQIIDRAGPSICEPIFNKEKLLESLKRLQAYILSEKTMVVTDLEGGDGGATFTGRLFSEKGGAPASEFVPLDLGIVTKITLNLRFLIDAVSRIPGDSVQLEISDQEKAIFIHRPGEQMPLHIQMPIKN